MAEPFLSEIRIMSFNFPPEGWAQCDGQTLPINQNQALFSLLGTTFGGDGRASFGLPDLRGRTSIHLGCGDGSSFAEGQKGGEPTHVLNVGEIPAHIHPAMASSDPVNSNDPAGRLAGNNQGRPYADFGSTAAMREAMIADVGGQAHENMQPYLALNFCIALRGAFPSRN